MPIDNGHALICARNRLVNAIGQMAYPAAYAAILFFGIVFVACFAQFTVDDAFIVFRYSLNFVEHGIWNWNLDGPHVEAYTGFLELIPFTAGMYASINPVVLSKIIGVLSVAYMALRVIQETKSAPFRLFGIALLLGNPFTYVHAFSGLETPLFMAFLFELGVILVKRYEAPIKLPMLCLALALTRPEGALLSLAFIAIYCYRHPINRKFLLALALVGSLTVAYEFWRLSYFGLLFPNTYYAKHIWATPTIIPSNLFSGRYYFFILGIAAFFSRGVTRLFIITLIVTMIFAYLPTSLMMNYADRFFFQFTLPGILAFLLNCEMVGMQTAVFAAIVSSILLVTTFNYTALKEIFLYTAYNNIAVDLGKRLRTLAGNDVALCTQDVGVMPYFSRWHTLDGIGLASHDVAVSGGVTQQVFDREHPTVVLFSAATPAPASIYVERYGQGTLLSHVQKHHYVPVTAAYTGEYYLISFVDPQNAKFSAIKKALLENAAIANSFQRLSLGQKSRKILVDQIGFRDIL